jgi:hypothetical protein
MNGNSTAVKKRKSLELDQDFYCRSRRKEVQVGKCLDDYLDSNALGKRRSACWRCLQGKLLRKEFSEGQD